jgi:hypothetical protein
MKKEIKMEKLFASMMTLAVLSSSAFALFAPVRVLAEPNYNCSQDSNQRIDYLDCNIEKNTNDGSAGLVIQSGEDGGKSSIGNFIDETAEEKNQRSTTK